MIYLAWKQLSLKFSLICFHRVEAFGTDMAQGVNMASIVLRKNRWRVQIRKQGHCYFSKTFLYKENAKKWARKIECAMSYQQKSKIFKELKI